MIMLPSMIKSVSMRIINNTNGIANSGPHHRYQRRVRLTSMMGRGIGMSDRDDTAPNARVAYVCCAQR